MVGKKLSGFFLIWVQVMGAGVTVRNPRPSSPQPLTQAHLGDIEAFPSWRSKEIFPSCSGLWLQVLQASLHETYRLTAQVQRLYFVFLLDVQLAILLGRVCMLCGCSSGTVVHSPTTCRVRLIGSK